ncbi:MAG TPA: cytochrome c [Acidimicrobiia bacterium]|nr:cytochrome c [Acidimicrobiia bacterium]
MRLARLLIAAGLSVTLAACVDDLPADATGEEIYVELCARCHSADLGGGVGPALGPGSNAAAQPDEFLTAAITEGRGRMPSFAQTLSSEQIERVVAYLRESQGAS